MDDGPFPCPDVVNAMIKEILNYILPHKTKKRRVSGYYNGAIPSLSRPIWYDYLKDAHIDISKVEREQIVIKSRDLEKNNAYWPKYLSIHENYTVGRGIPVTPASSDPEFNALMRSVFEAWAEDPLIDSRMDLSEMQRTMARATARDGEVFILQVWDERNHRKIQLLETQRVGYPQIDSAKKENIYDGVELDKFSKPVAYYIRQNMQRLFDPSTVMRIPARSVYHVFNPERFGQVRGMPLCANVINDLIDLDLLHKYEMDAAKFNSQKMAAWTRQGDDLAIEDSPFSPGTGNTPLSLEERQTRIEQSFGGTVVGLNPGETLTPYISQRPSVITQEYWEFLLKKTSAGIGYTDLLIFPRSVQGTVVRANLETTAAVLKSEYEVYAKALRWIYRFIAEEHAYKTRVNDWWKCSVQAPRSPVVDLERNTSAIIDETRNGMRSLSYNCNELGRSMDDVLEEKGKECQKIKEVATKYGITVRELLSSMIGEFAGNLPKEEASQVKEDIRNEK